MYPSIHDGDIYTKDFGPHAWTPLEESPRALAKGNYLESSRCLHRICERIL